MSNSREAHRRKRRQLVVAGSFMTLLLAACGGDGGGSPTAPPAPTPTSPIAGSYDVTVALSQTSCGPVTVQPQPTSISHVAGATRFTLTHGANTFAATLAADSTFVADPLSLPGGDGSTLTVNLAGRFSGTQLEATVRVDVRGRPASPADCAYSVQWNGRRTG